MDIEEKIVFAVAPLERGGPPVLMLGIPRKAWEYMHDGKTHTLDLGAIGVPVRLMLYGGENHTACLKTIEDACKAAGVPLDDQRRKDFSLK